MLARALFVLLVVLNLGVAVWWWWHEPATVAPADDASAGVPRLQLAGERQAAPDDADALAEVVAPTTLELPADAVCLSLGPYPDATSAVAAQARLAASVLHSRIVERSVGRVRGWRVIVPSLPSVTEAEALAARIAAAGFSDYFVMRQGADANAVALGRYQSEAAARRRAEALAGAGFEVRAEPVGATLQPWLDVALPAAGAAAPLQSLAGAASLQPLACDALQ